MNSIGHIIKQERLNQNIKQISLARGICSTSYLSKIENNSTFPSEDIITLLLKKLNLQIEEVSEEQESILIESFYNLYKDGIHNRDKNTIRKFLDEFSTSKMVFLQPKNYYNYNLYMFRLMLVLNEVNENIQSYYEVMIKMHDDFDDKQKFIFNLNLGLYYLIQGDYLKSLKQLEQSLGLVHHITNEDWEDADFYNVISMSYFKNNEFFNSINYASKSLQYYKDNLLFKRAIDNYIVMGMAYKRIRKFKEAEKHYHLANKLAIDYKLVAYEGIIYQNLGSLFSIQENHAKSIEYFNLSLKCKGGDFGSEGYLLTVLSIVKEYSKQKDAVQVLYWCKRGLEKIEEEKTKAIYNNLSYHFHFKIYSSLHSSSDELEDILKKAIKHFEIAQDDRHAQKYSILLADHYFNESKFKTAGLNYQKANQILLKQNSIVQWEDL
ncbi:MAG: helix-turn-helix domain-containing protein [Paenisporosarcina sp.]